jgi:hypothetical protein
LTAHLSLRSKEIHLGSKVDLFWPSGHGPVCVNAFPGMSFVFGTPPWGAYRDTLKIPMPGDFNQLRFLI